MPRGRALCIAVIAAGAIYGSVPALASAAGRSGATRDAVLSELLKPAAGAGAALPANTPTVRTYIFNVDLVFAGFITVNSSTQQCVVTSLIGLSGPCTAGATFSATLSAGPIALLLELRQGTGADAYSGSAVVAFEPLPGETLEYPVYVELRKFL